MTDLKKDLSVLVNNESFLRWLRGKSSSTETKKWQKWRANSDYNRELTKKAQKIVHMPFKNPDVSLNDIQAEKEKFDQHFLRLVKKRDL